MVLYDVVDIQPAHFDMKKDSAKANSQRDTFEAAESLSETSVSTNSISQNAGNVNSESQNSGETDCRFTTFRFLAVLTFSFKKGYNMCAAQMAQKR